MARNKHEYVVGFKGNDYVKYGRDDPDGTPVCFVPATILQAKRYYREANYKNYRIFKLIDVTDAVMGENEHGNTV
jgi:hypothetical protein